MIEENTDDMVSLEIKGTIHIPYEHSEQSDALATEDAAKFIDEFIGWMEHKKYNFTGSFEGDGYAYRRQRTVKIMTALFLPWGCFVTVWGMYSQDIIMLFLGTCIMFYLGNYIGRNQ